MPPKTKKKGKKDDDPPVHPTIVRNRLEYEKKKEKNQKRTEKKNKRIRKQNRKKIASAICDADNPETADGKESEIGKNINLPHSSCTEAGTSRVAGNVTQKRDSIKKNKNIDLPISSLKNPSTSQSTGHQVTQQSSSIKKSKDINLPNSSSKNPSTSRASGQVTKQSDSIDESKNIKLPNPSSTKPSSSRTIGHQVVPQNVKSKTINQTGNDSIPKNEKTLIQQKASVLKNPKIITDSKEISSNDDEAIQISSQSIPQNNPDDKKLQNCMKENPHVKDKEIAKVETLKSIKSVECASNTFKSVPPEEHRQSDRRNKLQQKLIKREAEKKSLNEQEPPSITGNITALAKVKSDKNSDKESLFPSYNQKKKTIRMGDRNIQIVIKVGKGIQVVCNSRRRPAMELVHDIKSFSDILEGHATARQAEDIKADSEKYYRTSGETKCDSSSLSEFPSRNFLTLDNQATAATDAKILIDSEQNLETAFDTNWESSSIGQFPEQHDSSRVSLQENVEKVCNDYLRDIKSASEKFDTRVENYVKGDSLKSSDIKEK